MTPEQAYNKFQSEPDYLVSAIVANNLERLNELAQQYQLSSRNLSADGMFALFNELAKEQDFSSIEALLSGLDYQAGKLPKGTDKFFFENFSPAFLESPTTVQTEAEFWEQYNDQGNGQWWTDFDWGGVVDSLGGVIEIFSGWGADGEETFTPSPSTQPPAASNTNNSGMASGLFTADNLKIYGPYVLILALVLWMAYRKKL
jgi:hypothetical protein